MLNHPNFVRAYFAIEIAEDCLNRSAMIVETTLHMNLSHRDFDAMAFDDLVNAAKAYAQKLVLHVTIFRFISVRGDQS
jgi:hypothetical protein